MNSMFAEIWNDMTGLARRIVAMEKRPEPRDGLPGRDGLDGKDGASIDMSAVQQMVANAVADIPKPKDGKDGQDGADGKSVDADAVALMIADAVAALPMPKDGVDGKSVERSVIEEMVRDAVAAMPKPKDGVNGKDAPLPRDGLDGRDGRDVDPETVTSLRAEIGALKEAFDAYVAAQATAADDRVSRRIEELLEG